MGISTAALIAGRLREHGVRYVFGIPGGASIPYIDSLRNEGIGFILTSHESAAAVMADVTARITGVTGVCHATYGPGATNLLTGVGGAFLDRSPVIALTSVMGERWAGRTAQMNIDHLSLFRPVTKASYRLTPGNAGMIMQEAFDIANSEYPGPVHIGLPDDIAFAGASEDTRISENPGLPANPDVSGLLSRSGSPVIAIGLTAARLGIGKNLKTFLDSHPVPVVVTPMAKDVISTDHPCFAGVLFHALSDRLKPLYEKTDLVIGLGYDPVEYNYESWMPDVPLLHFGTIASDLPGGDSTCFVSSPGEWFSHLGKLSTSPATVAMASEINSSIRKSFARSYNGFSPVEALNILRNTLPCDAIITADVGSHLHLLGQQWDIPPEGRLIITNGWSSMGFGLPAALAAALNCPGKTVVCVTGDGGFSMSAGEMMTARRYGLKIIVVVLADGELNLIRLKQDKRGVSPAGVNLYKNSMFGGDTFLGTKVMHADTGEKFRAAIHTAVKRDETVIIETSIDPSAYSELIIT